MKTLFIDTRTFCALILLCSFLLASCGQKAIVAGNVLNAENNEPLALSVTGTTGKIEDSVRLNSSGRFSLKYEFGKSSFPVFVTLSLSGKNMVQLLLEPGERVEVKLDAKNPAAYELSGSEGSALMKILNDKTLGASLAMDSILAALKQYENTPQYEAETERANKELSTVFTRHKRDLIRFVVANSKSCAAYSAIYQTLPDGPNVFGKETDALYFKILADSLETRYPRSPYVWRLRDDYASLTRASSLRNLMEKAESSGMPDVAMPDATGTPVKLSSLRGKVVLLNFWSSRDRLTSTNNMELLPIYERYREAGFEIYQVSLDENRDSWLQTINTQKLPWINVCDFAGTATYPLKLYNVTKLPANYLIDRQGEIAGKNLFGKQLEDRLKEEFKTTIK
ncbi:MAG: TlpA family protein disulfide reductase [Prevotellaceae bacterium]|nr:TlpA family protein disulfide reductase [Prevotellaceae bacterium]